MPKLPVPSLYAACLLVAAIGCGDNNKPVGVPNWPGSPDANTVPSADASPLPPDAPDGTPSLITCPEPVPGPASGICDATPGTGTATVLRGDVLSGDTIYENGAVVMNGATIACVGCDCQDTPGYDEATRIDCAGAVISPGLINTHEHMTFSENAPLSTGTTRYAHRHEWRAALSTPSNAHGTSQTSSGMRWAEIRMAMSGATSMVSSGRALGMVRNLDNLTPEEVAAGFATAEFETFPLGDSNRTFRQECNWNYRFGELDVSELPAYLPHIAEGINNYAQEEFRCQSRSVAGARDHTEGNTAHIHSIGLHTADYYHMARDGAQIIWSPRSNISLYGNTADVATFHRLGGRVALGTDWSYSGSANMLRELTCADEWNRKYLNSYFSDKQLWEMATINAAIVTGNEAVIGSLEAGKVADIAVFARGEADSQYRAVLQADNRDVALVLLGGAPLYGEDEVITTLSNDKSCEVIDMCGEARAICVSREFEVSYAMIAAEVQSGTRPGYQTFFCELPPGEPTCVPSRPGEYEGVASAEDIDGDGIANENDNCEMIFNPIRPIDNAVQPDGDGDGMGDPCDPEPLAPDFDGDGIANDSDNCRFIANPEQEDGDSDGRGNACDACPTTASTASLCPPVPVTSIQNGEIPEGNYITVDQVVVTGVYDDGFTVQDPNAASPAYSGIFVFYGRDSNLNVGDLVRVGGDIDEYFGLTELRHAILTRRGTGQPIAPAPVTVEQAASEEYEGVLVRLTDVTTVDATYNCNVDSPSCMDSNLWRANSKISNVLVYDLLYQDMDWQAKVGTTPVSGVMHYRFDRRRIMPRTTADLGQ